MVLNNPNPERNNTFDGKIQHDCFMFVSSNVLQLNVLRVLYEIFATITHTKI